MTFRLSICMTIRELYRLEKDLGIPSRAIDMARCVNEDPEECEEQIKIVIEKDAVSGQIEGFSSPFEGGPVGFMTGDDLVRDCGDRMNEDLIKDLVNELSNL